MRRSTPGSNYSSNVRQFKSPGVSGRDRIIAALGYFFLAYTMQNPIQSDFIPLLFMAILYGVFVFRQRHKFSPFLRYHLLQAIILYLFLTLFLNILVIFFRFVVAGLNLIPLLGSASGMLHDVQLAVLLTTPVIMIAAGAFLGVTSLMGRLLKVPYLRNQIEYWS